ncbi:MULTISPECIES: hypothetical protein [Comamonas]|uniref:hypothetical protein n=1 Tax=Comamonas TaxID=283 RepID=UPI00237E207F|nr:hypothetical protein [Comamonas aquatica]MDE1554386.1 hypothetical protein [Comamonas aquatica]
MERFACEPGEITHQSIQTQVICALSISRLLADYLLPVLIDRFFQSALGILAACTCQDGGFFGHSPGLCFCLGRPHGGLAHTLAHNLCAPTSLELSVVGHGPSPLQEHRA